VSETITKLHVGCGNTRLDGFVNVDFKESAATDIVHDCSDLSFFAPGSFNIVFAHSFFEHLRHDAMLGFLKSCLRTIMPGGTVLLMGIPNFKVVAEAYLKGQDIRNGAVFDLEEASRFTHAPWVGMKDLSSDELWGKTHKSLLDPEELKRLTGLAGFQSVMIFGYIYPGELLRLNMGIMASNAYEITKKNLENAIKGLGIVDMDSVKVYHSCEAFKWKEKGRNKKSEI